MAFSFSSALEGGVEGAAMGGQTGNPYVAIGAALGNAVLKGFSKKKGSEEKAGSTSSGGGIFGGGSGGFSSNMIMDILSKFTGGLGGGAEEAAAGSSPQAPSSPSQYIPPALVGFPSLSRGGVAQSLKDSISKRRGF